ncbi:MAG: hypothetical protein RL757_2552 [Bacteroidota bacterium]|jgi:hypothetical protein
MSLLQAKTHLEKVISLYRNMVANEKAVSSIERDLMLEYIRNLYETFVNLETQAATSAPNVSIPKANPTPRAEVRVEIPKPEPPPAPKPEIKVEPKVEAPRPTPPPPPAPPKMEEKVVAPAPPPPPPVSKPVESDFGKISSEIKAIFAEKGGNELSDRLSQMPIADITKAFSINDKILNIKELFAGNAEKYSATLQQIQQMSDVQAAFQILMPVAVENNWAVNEDRNEHAQRFVKLVRRRFK